MSLIIRKILQSICIISGIVKQPPKGYLWTYTCIAGDSRSCLSNSIDSSIDFFEQFEVTSLDYPI